MAVKFKIVDGGLAVPVSADAGSAGLIITGVAVAGKIAFTNGFEADVFELSKLQDLDTKCGINKDTTGVNKHIYDKVKEYFDQSPGSALFLQVVDNSIKMPAMVDKDGVVIKNLVSKSKNLQTVGVFRLPALTGGKLASGKTTDAAALADTISNGIAKECYDSITKAQAAGEHYADTLDQPLIFVLGGHFYTGDHTQLYDFSQRGVKYGRVSVVLTSKDQPTEVTLTKTGGDTAHKVNYGNPIVGAVLGKVMSVDPATNIGERVVGVRESGDPDPTKVYLEGTYLGKEKTEDIPYDYDSITTKKYIIAIKVNRTNGVWFNNDNSLGGLDSDYRSIKRQRVMDLARQLVFDTYKSDINGKLDLAPDGTISPAALAYYTSKLENTLNENLIQAGQAVGYDIVIDPNQNVLITENLEIGLSVQPYANVGKLTITMQYKQSLI